MKELLIVFFLVLILVFNAEAQQTIESKNNPKQVVKKSKENVYNFNFYNNKKKEETVIEREESPTIPTEVPQKEELEEQAPVILTKKPLKRKKDHLSIIQGFEASFNKSINKINLKKGLPHIELGAGIKVGVILKEKESESYFIPGLIYQKYGTNQKNQETSFSRYDETENTLDKYNSSGIGLYLKYGKRNNNQRPGYVFDYGGELNYLSASVDYDINLGKFRGTFQDTIDLKELKANIYFGPHFYLSKSFGLSLQGNIGVRRSSATVFPSVGKPDGLRIVEYQPDYGVNLNLNIYL